MSILKTTIVADTGQIQLPSAKAVDYPVAIFREVGTTTWTAPSGVTSVQVLVVGGGGGGGTGSNGGGGGGAGGVIYNSNYAVTPGTAYTVTVGAGGSGSVGRGNGTSGGNSVFATLTAIGGGAGGGGSSAGSSGGSGGGGSYPAVGGSGTAGQGTAGGSGNYYVGGVHDAGGGGGGAGSAGATATATAAGNGGDGLAYAISGQLLYYGGGGGGASNNQSGTGPFRPGTGGKGGGGTGGIYLGYAYGTPGQPGTGGGGGGGVGTGSPVSSGAGGSGIVIISWTSVTEVFRTAGSTTWTCPADVTRVEALVVAGGGGGGGTAGGGGGAGGVVYSSALAVTPGTNYTVTVGAGGTASTGPTSTVQTNGGNSSFSSLLAFGGGYGGTHLSSFGSGENGNNGGSGGGASMNYNTVGFSGGTGVSGQGNAGGSSFNRWGDTPRNTAGGGGAGEAGKSGIGTIRGVNTPDGGRGVQYSISGVPTWYGGGGGGGDASSDRLSAGPGIGGLGGGGNGAIWFTQTNATAGTPNTGGGGGGANNSGPNIGGAGGSGIVILRYNRNTQPAGVAPSAIKVNANATRVEFRPADRISKVLDYKGTNFSQNTGFDFPTTGLCLYLDANNPFSVPVSNSQIWYDLSSMKNHFTAVNTTIFGTTKNGGGFYRFTGDSGSPYNYFTNSSFSGNPRNQMTINVWVRSVTPSKIRGAYVSGLGDMYLGQFDSNDGGATCGIHWALTAGGSRPSLQPSSTRNVPYEWQMVTGVYDGSNMRLYYNATLLGSTPSSGLIQNGTTYVIGTYIGGLQDGTHQHSGDISIVQMWARGLGQAEVTQVYNAFKGRFGK